MEKLQTGQSEEGGVKGVAVREQEEVVVKAEGGARVATAGIAINKRDEREDRGRTSWLISPKHEFFLDITLG